MARAANPCPARCSGGTGRQHRVEASTLEAAGLSGDWIKSARRCGYCDEIYSIEADGRALRRGHFAGNTLMLAENWTPYRGH